VDTPTITLTLLSLIAIALVFDFMNGFQSGPLSSTSSPSPCSR